MCGSERPYSASYCLGASLSYLEHWLQQQTQLSETNMCRALVSGVIVVLNMVLKQALQLLVSFEKHWTKSDQERQYAVMAFVSQLLNSVLVLLLVNARSSSASAVINSTLSGNNKTSW